jgi:thiamine biosynthesis lipoprotein
MSSFSGMGTTIEVWCNDSEQEAGARALFAEVEAVCSRFRSDSELSTINRAAGGTPHRLSPLLAEVIRAADVARVLTGGLVDIGIGSAVSGWGYDRTFDEVVALDTPPEPPALPGWMLEGDMLFTAEGTKLDLGGIAKGWTCDRAVEDGICVVASAGGDMRSAHAGTTVTVLDPWDSVAARVRLGVGALATSSVARRRWKAGGRDVSHLMDPRTMTPAETPILSATVLADTAVEAESGAKSVLLLGEDGLAWADAQPWIRAALIVWHDGSVFATHGLILAA